MFTREIAALERPRIVEPRPPRRYKRPRASAEPVTFQLLQCKHHAASSALLMTGRTNEGHHVTVSVPDPEYCFYLQRAKAFTEEGPQSAVAFLAQLEDLLVQHAESGFSIPTKGGDPGKDREDCAVSRAFHPQKNGKNGDTQDRSRIRIRGWAHADGVFRTMYGWTPPEYRLDNLLAIYVHDPRLVRLYTQFIDSDEYLRAVGALNAGGHPGGIVRAFQGPTVPPELRLRMQQKISLGAWVALTRYYAKPADLAPLYTDRYYVADGGMLALRPLPERTDTAPLRVLSYDIEAAGRNGRFPAPRWTVARMREFLQCQCDVSAPQLDHARPALRHKAISLGMARQKAEHASFQVLSDFIIEAAEEKRKKNPPPGVKKIKTLRAAGVPRRSFASVAEMRTVLSREYPRTLKSLIPTDRDTDPAFLIVAVEWIYGESHDLVFHRQQALLYRHPQQERPYDRPERHSYVSPEDTEAWDRLDPTSLSDQYRTLPVREFATESEMIIAFTKLIHEWMADIVTGWNTTTFDFPFLYERIEFLRKLGSIIDQRILEAHGPLNFGLVRGGSSYAYSITKTTNAGGDRAYLKVSMDYLSHLDGQVVWENTSFGVREERGNKLDIVSEGRLTYPGTKIPRRKVEVDVTKGEVYWREGGRWLWIFIAYCAVDARLPVLLLQNRGKISMAVGLARLANVSLEAVYANGLQMKVVSMLAQEWYEHRGNRELLVEYGRRHFHWPDTWLRVKQELQELEDGPGGIKRARQSDSAPLLPNKRFCIESEPQQASQYEPKKHPSSEEEETKEHKRAWLKARIALKKAERLKQTTTQSSSQSVQSLKKMWTTIVDWLNSHPRFQPVPKGMKGYEGAHVFDPTRGFIIDLIATADFASLYPFILISHFLGYSTFLTSMMIKHYGVPRHHYVTVPLGEASRIFCGESRYDPVEAAANEYRTHEIKVAHFYVDADNGLRNMLLRVYARRKEYKADMAQWKLYKLLLQRGDSHEAWTRWRDDPQALPGADAYIENGRVYGRLANAVNESYEAYRALHATALAAVGGSKGVDPVGSAINQASVANASQLACKFFINGTYGFTTSSAQIAMVPLMEIGAAVTSYGRVCIRSSSYVGNHMTVPAVVAGIKERAREDLDVILDDFLSGAQTGHQPVRLLPLNASSAKTVARERTVVRNEHRKLVKMAMHTHGGDSVVGATPVLVRRRPLSLGPWVPPEYVCIEALHEQLPLGAHWWTNEGEKEVVHLPDDKAGAILQVWSDRGWTAVTRIIRHETRKRLCRVTTPTGTVTVTEDHSLLAPDGQECRPGEVVLGTPLLHHQLPAPSTRAMPGAVTSPSEAFVMGLFLADGSCSTYPSVKSGIKYTWAITNRDRTLLAKAQSYFNGLSPNEQRCGCTLKVLEVLQVSETMRSSNVYKLVAKGQPRDLVQRYRSLFYDKGSNRKRIPREIQHAHRTIRQAFFDGYNGYYAGNRASGDHVMRFDTKGQLRAAQLYWLADSLDHRISLHGRTDAPQIHRLNIGRGRSSTPAKEKIQITKLEWLGPNPTGARVYDLETNNHHFAAGVGELVVHNTDSIMLGYPRSYATRDPAKVVKLATFVASWIDQYMRDLMLLEQEKTSLQTALFERKNYFMDVFGNDDTAFKGFSPVRRDTLPFVRFTIIHAIKCVLGKALPPGSSLSAIPDTHEERVLEAVSYMRRRLLALARGEIPLAELTQSQQIRKLVYESPPVVMGAVEKMQGRGQRVQVGDRLLFVFCRLDQETNRIVTRKAKSYIKPDKARDIVDDVTHVIQNNIPLDYEYYYQNKVKNPFRTLLRPFLAPVADYPAFEIGMSAEEEKIVKDRAAKVKAWQNAQVDRELFTEVDAFFAKRRHVTYHRTMHTQQRQTALSIEYECPICADFFSRFSLGRPAKAGLYGGICPACEGRRDDIVAETRMEAETNKTAIAAELVTCHDCIERSGFEGDIQPQDCRKYFCSVFEKREALEITKKQLRRRLENLGVTDPSQLDW